MAGKTLFPRSGQGVIVFSCSMLPVFKGLDSTCNPSPVGSEVTGARQSGEIPRRLRELM